MKKSNKNGRSFIKCFAALTLTLAMVLSYIPMQAFAEGEEADAEPQMTELTAKEAEAELVDTEAAE